MKRIILGTAYYLAALALCLGILAWVMKLWRADLHVPLAYRGDALMAQLWVKGIIDTGWYLHNPFVGAPGTLDMQDFPMADNLHFLVMKLLALGCANYAVAYNLFNLLAFPLIALATLVVLRQLGFARGTALLGSMLFTFLPYHFHSGMAHVFLSSYYLVPFTVLITWRLYQGRGRYFSEPVSHAEPGLAPETGESRTPMRVRWCGWPFVAAVALCLLMASAGVYYAFFACFFFLIAGIAAASLHQSSAPLRAAGILVAATTLGVVANLAPSFLYRLSHGPNPEAVVRYAEYADLASLTIKDLLVPVERPDLLGFHLFSPYSYVSLGVLGSLGFVVLIGRLLFRRPAGAEPALLDALSTLNVLAVLLGTFGGFGFLLNELVASWIRCYYRLGVYIAFFALVALLVVLDKCAARWAKTPVRRLVFQGLLVALLALGVFDQTDRHTLFIPAYDLVRDEFHSDAAFVRQIEDTIPGGEVFQLPYLGFPETAAVREVCCYDHLRGYLHSRTLRWSHGAMQGREADLWQRWVVQQPVEDMVRSLALAGFGGIYVDRQGYADRGTELEGQLTRLLHAAPLVSPNPRLAFFDLTGFTRDWRHRLSSSDWETLREKALHPVLWTWRGGFAGFNDRTEGSRHTCSAQGELHLINRSGEPRDVALSLECTTGLAEALHLRIEGPGFAERMEIVNGRGAAFARTVCVPPGDVVIRFVTDAGQLICRPSCWGEIFKVDAFRLKEMDKPFQNTARGVTVGGHES